jgi:hypothetical protein
MPVRLTVKQFEVIDTLLGNPGSRVPVSWCMTTVRIWDKEGEPRLGWVQNRTLEDMVTSGVLVKGGQWYDVSPNVKRLDRARRWVHFKHEG